MTSNTDIDAVISTYVNQVPSPSGLADSEEEAYRHAARTVAKRFHSPNPSVGHILFPQPDGYEEGLDETESVKSYLQQDIAQYLGTTDDWADSSEELAATAVDTITQNGTIFAETGDVQTVRGREMAKILYCYRHTPEGDRR